MFKAFIALTLGVGMFAGLPLQAQETWQEGKNYFLIEPTQATTTGDKVEVVEVFSYGCVHCNEVAPMVEDIAKRLPANAQFVKLPA